MIDKDSIVTCQWCQKSNTLEKWDEETYKECITRERRRSFRSLSEKSSHAHNSKFFYKCPSCGQWSRGNKVKISSSDEKITADPLFEVKSE